jgi:hypothetical protein
MSMKSDKAKTSSARSAGEPPRRPYVKPAFRHEQVFETMALACGKVVSTQQTCGTNRKFS